MIALTMGFFIIVCSLSAHSKSVQEWWADCKGGSSQSSCLSEVELSKFKTICSNKEYKSDCQKVVDYVVARTRVAEAKSFLLSGYEAQVSSFTENSKYLNDLEKIWNQNEIDKAHSFVFGFLPSCHVVAEKKLGFSKNLRPEIKEFQNEMLKAYQFLSERPCSDDKKGFVLVAVGKTLDSTDEFDIFTIDEKKKLTVVRTRLGAGPFISKFDQR